MGEERLILRTRRPLPSPGGGGVGEHEQRECEPGWGEESNESHPTPTL
ncbi:MAG: hypothetical protein QOG38_1961, partial [Hyphomicrobiales bacterium]|nr:hypothetical protein [Hyphomicrobiales bacterium]